MGLLLAWLAISRREPASLGQIAGWLAAHMPLMFGPAAVGLMEEGALLRQHGLGIAVALVVSSVLIIGVTAVVFSWALKRFCREDIEGVAGD